MHVITQLLFVYVSLFFIGFTAKLVEEKISQTANHLVKNIQIIRRTCKVATLNIHGLKSTLYTLSVK